MKLKSASPEAMFHGARPHGVHGADGSRELLGHAEPGEALEGSARRFDAPTRSGNAHRTREETWDSPQSNQEVA